MPRNSANAVRGRQGVWGARRGRSIMTKIVFCIAANLVFTVITGILLGPPPGDQVQAPAARSAPVSAMKAMWAKDLKGGEQLADLPVHCTALQRRHGQDALNDVHQTI